MTCSALALITKSLARERFLLLLSLPLMALPTRGRVVIETTVGELDIELWSKVEGLLPATE